MQDVAAKSPITMSADARCITCGYALIGLPKSRCPECGGTFDPADDRTYLTPGRPRLHVVWCRHRRRIVNVSVAVACVGLSWWSYAFGFSLLFWSPGVVLLVRRQWLAFVLLLLVNPLTILLASECREYASGGPSYVRPGDAAIQTPQGSDHPRTRLRGFDPGCGTRSENYWLRSSAAALARVLMHSVIGPPPGAYTGPYPTLAQCLTFLRQQGQPQPSRLIEQGIIQVGGTRYPLQAYDILRWGFVVNEPDRAPVTAGLFQSQCLVVRVPHDQNPPLASVKLFDATSGRAFAEYWDAGGGGGGAGGNSP